MRRALRRIGTIVGGFLAVIVLALAGLAIYAQFSFRRTVDRPVVEMAADTSPEGVERGEYLVRDVMNCQECHGPAVVEGELQERDAPLAGQAEELSVGPISLLFAGANLTPDPETGLGGWTDGEIVRAIREGLDQDGTALAIMPSSAFHHLSDADVAAVVGYLRSLDPISNAVPPVEANLVGKMVLAIGLFEPPNPSPPISAPVVSPRPGTPEYGGYLVILAGCAFCHGEDMAGGPVFDSPPGSPPASNLTPGGELAGWTEVDFLTAMQTGRTPTGRILNELMPWKATARLHDEDLRAIFQYLKTLPKAETPN